MTRLRGFSIVLHNVKDDCKSSVEKWFASQNPSEYLVAMEPYPQGEGFHIHVFVSFKNPRQFEVMLKSCQELSKHIVCERPEGETRDWGRVQVDKMRGSFAQATAYLTDPKKDKLCDVNVIHQKKGTLVCDVCSCLGTAFEFGADYPDGKTGRCRRCLCMPHRLLSNLGFNVPNLDALHILN